MFAPGDVSAIRSRAIDALLAAGRHLSASGHHRDVHPTSLGSRISYDLELLTFSIPYFLPADEVAPILATPVTPGQLGDLRLPYRRVLVMFGTDMQITEDTYPWPEQFAMRLAGRGARPDDGARGLLADLAAGGAAGGPGRWRLLYALASGGGGYVTGVVLHADPDGRLGDDVLWIVAADPWRDPSARRLVSSEPLHKRGVLSAAQLGDDGTHVRIRGLVPGWLSHAQLAPLVRAAAAAVAWGAWIPPHDRPRLPDPARPPG